MKTSLVMLAVLCALATVNAQEDDFVVNIIGSGSDRSADITVGPDNSYIVAYSQFSGMPIMLAESEGHDYRFTDMSWHYPLPFDRKGLVVCSDDSGNIAIAFNSGNGAISFGLKSSWFDWQVSEAIYVDGFVGDMVYSPQSIPHMVLSAPGFVGHATFNRQINDWEVNTVAGVYGPSWTDIDLDSKGHPVIAYTDQEKIRLTRYDGANWISLPPLDGRYCSIAVLPSDAIAVAYLSDGHLGYSVYYPGVGWTTTPLPFELTDMYGIPSLAVNSKGSVGIAYADFGGNLHYATNITAWSDVIVDQSLEQAIIRPSLVFDKNNKPLIAYYDKGSFWGTSTKVAGIGIKKHRWADLTDDGEVNLEDLAVLASQWQSTGQELRADFNGSGEVNYADLKVMAVQWLE